MTARKALAPCAEPGCPELTTTTRCATHASEQDLQRGDATQRGYGSHWRKTRARFLHTHRTCLLCGAPATVADHHPITRRELVAAHVPDPDAHSRLRPLCIPCHNSETARARDREPIT